MCNIQTLSWGIYDQLYSEILYIRPVTCGKKKSKIQSYWKATEWWLNNTEWWLNSNWKVTMGAFQFSRKGGVSSYRRSEKLTWALSFCKLIVLRKQTQFNNRIKVQVKHGVCFALKLSKELLLLFRYVISFCKDIPFPLITKLKSNRSLSYLSVNRIPT